MAFSLGSLVVQVNIFKEVSAISKTFSSSGAVPVAPENFPQSVFSDLL